MNKSIDIPTLYMENILSSLKEGLSAPQNTKISRGMLLHVMLGFMYVEAGRMLELVCAHNHAPKCDQLVVLMTSVTNKVSTGSADG